MHRGVNGKEAVGFRLIPRGFLAITFVLIIGTGCNLFRAAEQIHDDQDTAFDAGADTRVPDQGSVPADMNVVIDMSDPSDMTDMADMPPCVAESDADFCQRQGKNCGVLVGVDDCGESREAQCGDCDTECGEFEANVCGCPCNIDDDCRIPGERNPASECEVCDPATDAMGWTVDEGAACDDGNACSAESTCDAAGVCAATDTVGCDEQSTDCQVGSCDAGSMTCVVDPLPNDTACTDDALDCTTDVCAAGLCEHVLMAGTCLIDGACVADAATNPANPCEVCDVASSTTAWTITANVACTDGDGLSCTSGQCDATGVCQPTLMANKCLISGTCRDSGAIRSSNGCQACDPARDPRAWSNRPAATSCSDSDGLTCTTGSCNATGTCNPVIAAGSCVIGAACIDDGALDPGNDCKVCDPVDSNTSYSDITDGTACAAPLSCMSGSCDGGVCKTVIDPGFCVIGGVCFGSGDVNPANICEVCAPLTNAQAWSFVPDGTECNLSPVCTCNPTGQCLRSNGNPC